MRWPHEQASSGRPGSPGPSCSASSPATAASTSSSPPPTATPASPWPSCRRRSRRPTRAWCSRRTSPAARTGSTSCSSACRTRRRCNWRRSWSGRSVAWSTCRPPSASSDATAYPQWYGFEHDQPALLDEAVYGLPERHRAALPRRPARRHPGLLRHGGDPRAGAAARRRAGRADRAHRRRGQRGVRSRAGRRPRRRRSAPSTRTSSPTACSTTGTPRRSSRTSVPRCCSRRTWRR